MKKWMLMLASLGYISPVFATAHDSFLVTGETLQEVSNYDHVFDIPNFFTRVFPQNLNPNLVIVPRTNSGFMFGITGMLLRPFDNQTDYAIVDPTPGIFSPSLTSNIREISPEYNFGYGAYIGYVYPYTGRDIKLEVYNLDDDTTDSIVADLDGAIWTPLALYDQTTQALRASAHYDTSLQYADLLMGQTIFAGSRFHVHAGLGLEFARIERELNTRYQGASSLLEPIFGDSSVNQKSTFSGVGPAFQMDGTYFIAPHIGITGHLLASILIGVIDSEINYTEDLIFPTEDHLLPGNTSINLTDSNRAVVNLNGKLGIVYEYPFCNSYSKFNLELGYQFNHFFNAVDTYRSAGGAILEVEDTQALIAIDTPLHIKHPHDITFEGPYLSLGISGIACPNNVVIDPVCVTVPRLEGGFVFSIGAIYYIMEHNHRDYALLDPLPTDITGGLGDVPILVPSTKSTLESNDPANSYGLLLDIGYVFRDTPYDVTAHLEGLNTTDDAKVTAAPAGVVWPILVTPFLTPNQTPIFARDARSDLKFSYYEYHVDFGQAISADNLAWFRIFEGIEYARLQSDIHVHYHNVTSPAIDVSIDEEPISNIFFPKVDVVQESHFAGYGPRFGVDMVLPMGGFNLISEFAGGFLFGNLDTSYKSTTDEGIPSNDELEETIPPAALGTQLDSENQISPFLDMKVGIGYGFNLFSRTKWNIELGYKAAHYFNAATTFQHLTNSAAVYAKQVDDVTVNGPYLSVSAYGFGTCPPDCRPHDPYCVIVPELRGGFEAAIEYIYARPNVTNLDYGIIDPDPVFIPNLSVVQPPNIAEGFNLNPSARSKVVELKPQFESGYRAHLGYIFPLTSNDISINFVDYQASSSTHTQARPGDVLWTITNGAAGALADVLDEGEPTHFPVVADRADINASFDWQTGNVEFGKRVKFYNLMTRAFAGLTYAKVTENINITYQDGTAVNPNPDDTGVPIVFTEVDQDTLFQGNSFSGFGPRLGLAGDLGFLCGFSLVGLVGTDLLVGTFDSSLLEQTSLGDNASLNPRKRTRFVPAVDAKIGLAYTIPLKDCAQISTEIGYEMNHYFNAKDSLRFSSNSNAFVKMDQDISFDGPYIRLQVGF